MPSKNPRLSVVLSPALAATLAALAEETGDSASSLVRGLLEQTHPALQRMLDLVKATKRAKGQIGAGVGTALERVVSDLEDAAALAESRVSRAVADLVDTAEKVKGRRRPAASGASRGSRSPAAPTPVPVTRGSGGPRKAETGGRRGGRDRAV
jgi:hypothetical protein